ncbi:MAG: hypothetical protein Q7S02_06245 [bacterium]|nr:hypothetical protein [bacterium]
MQIFPIWKTAMLGTFPTISALRKTLIDGGYWSYIDEEDEDREYEYRSARSLEEADEDEILNELLARTPLAMQQTTVDLVRATLPQLGFTGRVEDGRFLSGPSFREIAQRIWMSGHRLCPAEVGPQLRLQYPRQPLGEVMNVAVEPISVPSGGPHPNTYCVFHDSCGRFVGWKEMKYDELSPTDYWVFVKPRVP